MLVHTSQAGGIIGRGGERMKELREETKASFKIFTQCCPESSDRVVAITGTVNVVVQAVQSIAQVISSKPIKGLVKPYDPHNGSPFRAHEYGGFCELPQANTRIPNRRPPDALSTRGWDSWPHCMAARPPPFVASPYARLQLPSKFCKQKTIFQLFESQSNQCATFSDDPRFRSTAENIPFYWPDSAFPTENHHPASIPPPPLGPVANAYGNEWQPELEQLVHNSDGSTSATLTVPHNVITSLFP